MTNSEILHCVHQLMRGEPSQADISELLLLHKCDYLYAKVGKKDSLQYVLERAINEATVKERYHSCTPLFEQDRIPYAVIKGAVLSQAMYKTPFLRSSGDIDILVRRQDADELKQLLFANGFVQGRITDNGIVPFSRREILFQTAMSHQTAPYIKETGNKLCPYINLDVNMDILWGESTETTDMNFILSHTTTDQICNISFRKLTPEMEFISLCLHHYKDTHSLYLLSQGSLRLGLYCELYDYLHNVHPDPSLLVSYGKKLNVNRYLYVCIYETYELFPDDITTQYLRALDSFKDSSLLDTFGLNEKEQHHWELPLVERLFHPNLAEYLKAQLSDKEKEKIKINRKYMR